MQKTLRLIIGDQLNHHHTWFQKTEENVLFLLMEVMQEQTYVMHHVQKIIGFFHAMRSFAEEISKKGHQVIYLKLDDKANKQSFEANIEQIIKDHKITDFQYQLPDEYRLDIQLKQICKSLKIQSKAFDTEHFLTNREDVKVFFNGKKQFLMENFYRDMRKKHRILMDGDDKPTGGQWNFDQENRKKYDGKVPLKAPLMFKKDVSAIYELLNSMQVAYFGNIKEKEFDHPTTREEALQVLDFFCDLLLPSFGTYEDAMLKEHATLFHSKLSFCLNLKLISPAEVVEKVISTYKENSKKITIAQVEGFIRQVIGWREYMRGLYWATMPDFAAKNFFENKRKLPHWYWDGKVKMNCLKTALDNSLDNAYAHHIQRLMVIGNFSLLAGLHPDEVDEWYLGVYIDAVEWVQITNTRGMSQYADGGIVGSKPYVSSANYIDKMSNYCTGCYYDKKKKYGDKACPFNSLYWNFYHHHQEKLKSNQRVSMMVNMVQKIEKKEMEQILVQADSYLKNINNL